MVMLPENTNTTKNAIENRNTIQVPRPYLGMSALGDECIRKQWLGWRWASLNTIGARTKRIFNRGDLEEPRIIADLKEAGVECFRRDEDGNQIEVFGHKGEEQQEIVGFAGHALGHTDGQALGIIEAPATEHLLEFKTMKNDKFETLLDKGVEVGFPTYYSQTQRYMGGLKLKRTFFVATNKDNEAREYLRIKFNPVHFQDLIERERNIIMSERPPNKIFDSSFYKCSWCNHYDVCHLGKIPVVSCRSCAHIDVCDNGKFECSVSGKELTVAEQREGCPVYKRAF